MSVINFSNQSMNVSAATLPRIRTTFCTIGVFTVWLTRIRQRRALAALDNRLLADIGLDARSARSELRKPFWRA